MLLNPNQLVKVMLLNRPTVFRAALWTKSGLSNCFGNVLGCCHAENIASELPMRGNYWLVVSMCGKVTCLFACDRGGLVQNSDRKRMTHRVHGMCILIAIRIHEMSRQVDP